MFLDMTKRVHQSNVVAFPEAHCDGWQAKQIGSILVRLLRTLPPFESRESGRASVELCALPLGIKTAGGPPKWAGQLRHRVR